MSFDLHISIPENSPVGQVVQRMVSVEHVTPEQAVNRLLNAGVNQPAKKSPALEMLGAFSSDEDSAITDEAMEHVRTMRQTTQLRDFGI